MPAAQPDKIDVGVKGPAGIRACDAWRLFVLVCGIMILIANAVFSLFGVTAIAGPLVVVVGLTLLSAFAVGFHNHPIETAVFALALAALTYLAIYSLNKEWDVRSIWFFHGKQIFYGDGPRELLDGYRHQAHPDYPKVFPLMIAGAAQIAGMWNEALPKVAVPLILALPLAFLWASITSPAQRVLFAAAIFVVCGRYLWSGMLDGVLAVYAAGAFAAFIAFRDSNRTLDGLCFILLIVIMIGLKAEGALAVAAFAVTIAFGKLLPRYFVSLGQPWRRLILPGIVFLVLVFTWQLQVKVIGAPNTSHFGGDVFGRLMKRLTDMHDLGRILDGVYLQQSLLIALVATGALGVFSTGMARRTALSAFAFALIYTVGIVLVYAMTPNNLSWHLGTSVRRIAQLPILVLLAGMILSLGYNATAPRWLRSGSVPVAKPDGDQKTTFS